MWIAPEGTRSKDDKLGPFKKGPFITAIQAGATIIPIGIRGANHILPAGTLQLNLAQEVAVHIGEPIDATQYTLENKDTLLAHVFRVMQRLTDE
jgi:1-acyl-sn-glycerol-3-phosphate acyltransferase